jgi:class 3 adenylate cyclase/tetratricopeptide (TPR) repeat protein
VQACQVCGGASPAQARFCMHCGTALWALPAAGENRQATVLFADLVGSTGHISGSDPEDAHYFLSRVVRRLVSAVNQQRGIVARIAGDGVLALFGAPLASEDHARRACQAALGIQEDLAHDPLYGRHGERLAIRIGIATGTVHLRLLATDLKTAIAPEGFTTHVAAKLQAAARPGAVLVSASVRQSVEGFFHFRPHPPLHLLQEDRQVEAFELDRAAPAHSRFELSIGRGLSALVGRQDELDWLARQASQVQAGRARVASLVGEAGVGKSRLCWEFAQRCQADGWRACSAPATANGTPVAFYPILSLLRTLYRIEGEGGAAQAVLQDLAVVEGLDVVPLQVLLGLATDDATWKLLDTRSRQLRTQEALLAALLAASRQAPCLLAIEDLHEADPETLALIDRLARHGGEGRVLLLVEHRPGHAFTFESLPGSVTLAVEPLPESQARGFLRQIGSSVPAFADLEDALVERVAGNPFFIEEGVRMLSAPRPPAAGVTPPPLPGSVVDVIEARIASLDAADRELVKLASAVGQHVHLPVLKGLFQGDQARLEAGVERLLEAGLLVGSGAAALRFKHAVTQDVAYRMMARPERRKIHSEIVTLLESQPVTAQSERVALLAQHATNAELWPQAVTYLEQAARTALERATPHEAIRLFDEALRLMPRLDPAQRSAAREIDIRLAIRGPLLAVGEFPRIGRELPDLERLADVCDDPARVGRVAVLVAGHRWLSGNLRAAMEAGRRAIRVAEQLGDFSLLVPARWYVGAALHELGDFEDADRILTANVDTVPEHAPGHQFGMAGHPAVFCRSTRSWMNGNRGNFDAARRDAADALRIGRASGNAFSLLSAIFAAGWSHLHAGEFDRAAALLEEGLALCERHGLKMWLSVLGSMQALALAGLGEKATARSLLDRAIPDPASDILTTPLLITLARARLALGQPDAAEQAVRSALARAVRFGERVWEAEGHGVLGELLAARGEAHAAAANAAFARALEVAADIGMHLIERRYGTAIIRV